MTDEELFVHAADAVPAVRPKYTPPPGVATPHNDPRKRLFMRTSPPHDVPRPPPPSPPHVSKGEWPITVDELVARAGAGVPAPGPINFNHAGPQGRYNGPKPKHEAAPTSLKTSAKARRDTDVEEIMEIIARRYYGDYDEY